MGKTKREAGDEKESAVPCRVCSLPSLRSYNAGRSDTDICRMKFGAI